MRPVAQQPAIFDRSGFALFAVRHDDRLAAAATGVAHRAQLGPERKCGATAAEQPRQVDLLQQCVGVVERPIAPCLCILGVVFCPGL